jgi:hypothetical protein
LVTHERDRVSFWNSRGVSQPATRRSGSGVQRGASSYPVDTSEQAAQTCVNDCYQQQSRNWNQVRSCLLEGWLRTPAIYDRRITARIIAIRRARKGNPSMGSNPNRSGSRITDAGSRICFDSGPLVCSEREGSSSHRRCRPGLVVCLRLGTGKVLPVSYRTQEPRRLNESSHAAGSFSPSRASSPATIGRWAR